MTLSKIALGLETCLYLGNIYALRDWGYAKDYVEAMWLMLQKNDPEDYVVGTGVTKSIEDFVKLAFSYVNLNYLDYVKFDENFLRPTEVDILIADSTKAKKKLKWKTSVNFESLVEMMVESDLKILKNTNQY